MGSTPTDPAHLCGWTENRLAKARRLLRVVRFKKRWAEAKRFLQARAAGQSNASAKMIVDYESGDVHGRLWHLTKRTLRLQALVESWEIRVREARDRYWEWLKTH